MASMPHRLRPATPPRAFAPPSVSLLTPGRLGYLPSLVQLRRPFLLFLGKVCTSIPAKATSIPRRVDCEGPSVQPLAHLSAFLAVGTFQSMTLPSACPEASVLPSGLK